MASVCGAMDSMLLLLHDGAVVVGRVARPFFLRCRDADTRNDVRYVQYSTRYSTV